jgi:DNA-binding transcriptional regulator YiaG
MRKLYLTDDEPLPADKFSRLIKVWRLALELSQSRAAAQLGVPKRTLAKWEQSRQAPRGKYRARIALLFRLVSYHPPPDKCQNR